MQKQRPIGQFTLCYSRSQTCGVIGIEMIFRPPRAVIAEGLRPIELACSGQGLVAHVRINQIDAVNNRPVGQLLKLSEPKIMSTTAVGFAQHAFTPQLAGDTGGFFDI